MADHFDNLCMRDGVKIISTIEGVPFLWHNRMETHDPRKRNTRAELFYSSFAEIMERLRDGHSFRAEDMPRTRYWEYLRGYHRSWRNEPLAQRSIRQMRMKFLDSVNLFYSIKDEGMRDPLCMIFDDTGRHLYRGYRRLTILHVLGADIARVNTVCIRR